MPHGERLFALDRLVGTQVFFSQVVEKLIAKGRLGLARSVEALCEHGLLHRIDLYRLLAVAPKSHVTAPKPQRRLSYEEEICTLEELGARVIQRGTALESIVAPDAKLSNEYDSLALESLHKLRYEAVLVRIIAERFRRQNIFSWNRIDTPDTFQPYVLFNGQVFSAYGFSYLGPLKRWKEGSKSPTACPVVIDCYHGICYLSQVESFVQRIERATIRRGRQQPVLGVIAARDFHRDAWDKARRESLMTINLRQMFGDEALKVMVEVERLIGGFGSATADDSQTKFAEITDLMAELKTNPIIADLRAISLEAMSALILQAQGFESPEIGRAIPWNNTTRDVDVFAIRGDNELRIVECKAHHRFKSLSDSEVQKFFCETVPALKQWLKQTVRRFKTCNAEIWTTGPKGTNAENALRELTPPRGDTWALRRMSDMHDEIPSRIRVRGKRLLSTIALTESDDEGGVD